MIEFFSSNWYWFMLLFYVAEKIVKLTPTKYDDIIIDILIGGIKEVTGKGKKKG